MGQERKGKANSCEPGVCGLGREVEGQDPDLPEISSGSRAPTLILSRSMATLSSQAYFCSRFEKRETRFILRNAHCVQALFSFLQQQALSYAKSWRRGLPAPSYTYYVCIPLCSARFSSPPFSCTRNREQGTASSCCTYQRTIVLSTRRKKWFRLKRGPSSTSFTRQTAKYRRL